MFKRRNVYRRRPKYRRGVFGTRLPSITNNYQQEEEDADVPMLGVSVPYHMGRELEAEGKQHRYDSAMAFLRSLAPYSSA